MYEIIWDIAFEGHALDGVQLATLRYTLSENRNIAKRVLTQLTIYVKP